MLRIVFIKTRVGNVCARFSTGRKAETNCAPTLWIDLAIDGFYEPGDAARC
jgi:hypothetical protein